MKYIKTYEEVNTPIYKIGDFVKFLTIEDYDTFYYGKIIDITKENPEESDHPNNPTFFYDIIISDGNIKTVWQTPSEGEIRDYWNITPEEKKLFDIKVSANKFNL